MFIAVDFDGTCVKHSFPYIGEDIGAAPVLKDLVDSGHLIILYTVRSGEFLDAAVNWFTENEIPLFGINENPTQNSWTQSRKIFANLYIDDYALGVPLVHKKVNEYSTNIERYVDWAKVRIMLEQDGIIE